MKKMLSYVVSAVSLLVGITAVSVPIVCANTNKENTVAYEDSAIIQEVENENADKERIVMYYDADMTQEVEHNYPDYSVNANGQTYGIGGEANYVEDFPDLIAVRGDNGKSGYVYTSEFFESPVSCPEEAVAYQKAVDNGEYTPKVLNVYESDGETVIDTFTETVTTKEDIEIFNQIHKD